MNHSYVQKTLENRLAEAKDLMQCEKSRALDHKYLKETVLALEYWIKEVSKEVKYYGVIRKYNLKKNIV
jgi:hypothetical protein